MKQLATIVVTYNSSEFILSCLRNLNNARKNGELQIVIVDNASSDNTINIVKDNFPHIMLIKNRKNLGLSKALNQGIRAVPAKYYLILNPDVFIKPEQIKKLIKYLDTHPDTAIVGPRLEYSNEILQFSARTFPTLWSILGRGLGLTEKRKWMPCFLHRHLMTTFDHERPQEVDWILGAALMIRGQTLSEIGHFDESYFLYYGDVNLCWRAWQKEWKVIYEPNAVAIHHYQRQSAQGGIFNPLKWSHFFSAMRFLIKKNFS